MTRLSLAAARATGAALPAHAGRLGTGIVHLGIGAFARAHTAVYTDAAIAATGDDRWGMLGVSQRSGTVPAQLAPQNALFAVATRAPGVDRVDVVAALTGALDGSTDPTAVVAAIADPRTHVVTLTVTEKGYRLRADGRLDLDAADVRADLAGATGTVVGQLAAGILARGGAPLTLVSCDNLLGNGAMLHAALADYADALGGADGARLAAALGDSVRLPATMVDRMVPATTDADLDAVAARLGLRDEAAVVAEPFRQWVLADDFAADRPAWERAGALFVDDVAPWEDAKLRVLNASHTLLAYLGLLGETPTIAETVAVDEWRAAVRLLVDVDVAPTLHLPAGLDLAEYRDSVIARFGNPHLGHTVAKVGADGSQKLAPRLLSTVRAARAAGAEPRWASLPIVLWAEYVRTHAAGLDDPRAAELTARAEGPAESAGVRLLESLAPDLAADEAVADLVTGWGRVVNTGGIAAVKEEIRAQF